MGSGQVNQVDLLLLSVLLVPAWAANYTALGISHQSPCCSM